ncbi:MAG TPA: hypothetical protein IAB59_01345 [Candidatus Onthousia faecipullorum]|uniref:Uncharacterized protein n=1 Tax=Candidatus Onthousia faecipullorum TaxID=2840887 RepID=A0A9D1KAD3_9FIRM|nr:hypothetical protein [Candidatus Onthousia faecipullorum]
MNFFGDPNFLNDALRSIFSGLDSLGYFLLDAVYNIFFTVANANIFQGVTINIFYERVQLILGVFMIFKLSITLLQIIINPDMYKDKQKGAGSLVTRIAVILVLLTLIVPIENVPNTENSLNEQISSNGILFGFLYQIQNTVIKDNVLGKLVLGSNVDSTEGTGTELDNMGDVGSQLAATVAKAFIKPTLSSSADEDNITAMKGNDGNSYQENIACNGGEADPYFNSSLTAGTLINHINDTCDSDDDGEVYVFNYAIIGGLICSLIMVFIILGFTIDVAVRAVKLAILRLIAPIPIISYIDPSQGKDGAFNNWVKTLTSTYLSLFVRLIIIYFGAYLIILLTNNSDDFSILQTSTSVFTSFFATIFIIIGILMFMKDAPKFFQDMLGIKGDGKLFSGIGTILGAAALTGGLVGSVATGVRAGWAEGQEFRDKSEKGTPARYLRNAWTGIGAGVAGLTSGVGGLVTGGRALATADKKVPSSVMSAMQKRNAMRASHSTALGRLSSEAYGMFTGRTLAEKDKQALEVNQAAVKQMQEWKSFTEGEAKKKGDFGYSKYGIYSATDGRTQIRAFNYERLVAAMNAKDSSGNFKYGGLQYNVRDFDANVMGEILKSQNSRYVKAVFDGTEDNPGVLSNWELAKKALADADIDYKGEYLDPMVIGPTIGVASSKAQEMQTGMKHIKHIANHNANKSK